MPVFNGLQGIPYTDLRPGDSLALFDAETRAGGDVSTVIARGESPSGSDQGITFQVHFASSPTASLTIKGSNVTPTSSGPQNGVTLKTVTTQDDSYTDTARWAFYWASLDSYSAGDALTVIAQR